MVDTATRPTTDRRPRGQGASPQTREERAALLPSLLAQRILVIDGAMGTLIQSYQLDEAGFRGERTAATAGRAGSATTDTTSAATTTCCR